MEKKKAKAVGVTMLDEVAWLFNLHGSDIDFSPGTCYETVGRVVADSPLSFLFLCGCDL
jgi:hypothetical protein